MNQFLKSASDRFNKVKEKEYLIAPLSEIDCEIFIELGQILKKAGCKEALDILKNYKEYKDSEVRDNLLQWNIDNPFLGKSSAGAIHDVIESEKEEVDYPPMLKVGDLMLKVNHLLGLEQYETVDSEGNEKYGLIINPTPEQAKSIPMYANKRIEWFSEEDRNKVISNLKSVYEENNTEFIDLME